MLKVLSPTMISNSRIEPQFPICSFPHSLPKPGPLHTIQMDENGCIYYSDELNHAVVSLEAEGKPRWFLIGKGTKPGQFYYPRGIALGWVVHEGAPVRCLAIADSWNRRIQFLDLKTGRLLIKWGSNDSDEFQEPVDIRFIPPVAQIETDPLSGYWLVLDKGRHQLWTIDIWGRKLRQWGTFVDSGTAAKWAASGIYPNLEDLDRRPSREAMHYNLLCQPTRILGMDADALYISEPYRLNLKLVAYGNFFPLSVGAFPDREWIAADSVGLIEWSRTTGRLNFYDCTGNLTHMESVEGIPVPSNLPADQFWLQRKDGIQPMKLIHPAAPQNMSPVQSLLIHTAEKSLEDCSADTFGEHAQSIPEIFDQFISLADEVIEALKTQRADQSQISLWDEQLEKLVHEWDRRRNALYADLRRFDLPILNLRAASCSGNIIGDADASIHALQLWKLLDEAINTKLKDLVCHCDDLFMLAHIIIGCSEDPPDANLSQLQSLAATTSSVMTGIVDWVLKSNGLNQRLSAPLAMPYFESNLDVMNKRFHPSGPSIIRKRAGSGRSSVFLKELRPIDCTINKEIPGAPTYLAMSAAGHLFVSLQKANRIISINADDEIQTIIGGKEDDIRLNQPAGIAFDSQQRLWIADSSNHRILLFDAPHKKETLTRILAPPEFNLQSPHGLIALPNDEVLVTDPGINSIFKIDADGLVRPLSDCVGCGLDSVKFPSSFCLDAINPQQHLWLVERRNHRLTKLDYSGRHILHLGSCGINPGQFLYPLAAAMFSDGVLAVTQGFEYPNLVFINSKKDEIARVYLDYLGPAGVFIHNDILYVCQYSGDLIHRYMRLS
jgi:hypothetical protein